MSELEQSQASIRPIQLTSGDLSHDFFMKTIDDRVLESDDFKGKKIWLAFYRYAGCPICAQHLAEVIEAQAFLKSAGIAFVAVYDCSPQNVPTWIRKNNTETIRIVADETQNLHQLFGAQKSWRGLMSAGTAIARLRAAAEGYFENNMDGSLNMMPAHILVGEDGRVHTAHYSKHAGDHITWKVVRAFGEVAATPEKVVDAKAGTTAFVPEVARPLRIEPQKIKARFVVVRKLKLNLGSESEFLKLWATLESKTKSLHPNYLGSRLHIDSDQMMIIHSAWASKSAWEQFWITKEQSIPEYQGLTNLVAQLKPDQFLRVVLDSTQMTEKETPSSKPIDDELAEEDKTVAT